MRTFLVGGLFLALLVTVGLGGGCSSGSFVGSDAGADGSSGPPRDGSAADSSFGDGGIGPDAADAAGVCDSTFNAAYDRTCVTAADCTTVARGCYCGSQPVVGVAKSASAAAQSCEASKGQSCALGCPNLPGRMAEDGQTDTDGGTIEVLCDSNECHTVVR